MNDNFVAVTGNCTRDPDLRFTPNGAAVAEFGLAVNRKWLNKKTDEWEEEVSFLDVTCWGKLGENVAESIQKGNRLNVKGRLRQESWEDKDTGKTRSKIGLVADDVSPSLCWATVSITKNERDDNQGGGNRSGGRKSGNSGGGSRRANEPPAGFDADEEPF